MGGSVGKRERDLRLSVWPCISLSIVHLFKPSKIVETKNNKRRTTKGESAKLGPSRPFLFVQTTTTARSKKELNFWPSESQEEDRVTGLVSFLKNLSTDKSSQSYYWLLIRLSRPLSIASKNIHEQKRKKKGSLRFLSELKQTSGSNK